ncbi:MAG: type II toxin-antitoxin system RelE/ParE family toxin [Planctomycetaceae bacterium]
MPIVHVSIAASQDFDQIWLYVATDDPIAADWFLGHIGERCQSYAHQPQLGESRFNLGGHLR